MNLQFEIHKISHITSNLFLGSVRHPRNQTEEFCGLKPDVIINCCNEYTHSAIPDCIIENYPIDDGVNATIEPYLDPTADSIHGHIEQGRRIYIHCMQGRSRSPSVVIYYLMKYQKMSFDKAYAEVAQVRPIILPNPKFVEEIKKKK